MTSSLTAVAAGTPLRRIDDVVQAVKSKIDAAKDPTKAYVGLEHMQSNGSALIGWTTAEESVSTNSVFAAGDILFGKLRPNLRKSVLAPFDGYCSTDVLVLRARAGVDPRFAARLFQSESVCAVAEATAIGTKMPRTSWNDLRSIRVFCPLKAEQSKLADIVDTLDTAIRQTEAIIEKLKQVKQGLMHDLLTRGIDENGELRSPHSETPHLYKQSPLGWIPSRWDVAPLGRLLHGITYGFTSPMPETKDGPWMLTGADIGYGEILFSSARHTSAIAFRALSKKSRPSVGDILVTKDGTLGRVAVLDRANVCVSQSVAVLSPKSPGTTPYLSAFLLSPMGQAAMLADAGGSTIAHLYISKMAELLVPLPEREEAQRIADATLSIEVRLIRESARHLKLRRARDGLIEDLLTGRVRVTSLLKE